MKDIFGQEFVVGCHIVHIGGKTQYAGAHVRVVEKITPKRIGYLDGGSYHGKHEGKLTYVSPLDAIVVDKLMTPEESE
jgi:hypothetical protein